MSHPTPPATLSEPETKLLNSLASRFCVRPNEEADLGSACKLSEVEREGRSNPDIADVRIAPVSTLVCTGKGSLPGTSYVVPSFAGHWGIIVRRTLFHLQYDSQTRTVTFKWQRWVQTESDSRHKIVTVGTTKYNTDELNTIGIFRL
jgi:hypothetical protein